MATMVSGSPLASRRIVCSNGRSKRENSSAALQPIGAVIAPAFAAELLFEVLFPTLFGAGEIECAAGRATAGVTGGVEADAAAAATDLGATKGAGAARLCALNWTCDD